MSKDRKNNAMLPRIPRDFYRVVLTHDLLHYPDTELQASNLGKLKELLDGLLDFSDMPPHLQHLVWWYSCSDSDCGYSIFLIPAGTLLSDVADAHQWLTLGVEQSAFRQQDGFWNLSQAVELVDDILRDDEDDFGDFGPSPYDDETDVAILVGFDNPAAPEPDDVDDSEIVSRRTRRSWWAFGRR